MLRSVSLSKSAGCKPKFQLPESAIEPYGFVPVGATYKKGSWFLPAGEDGESFVQGNLNRKSELIPNVDQLAGINSDDHLRVYKLLHQFVNDKDCLKAFKDNIGTDLAYMLTGKGNFIRIGGFDVFRQRGKPALLAAIDDLGLTVKGADIVDRNWRRAEDFVNAWTIAFELEQGSRPSIILNKSALESDKHLEYTLLHELIHAAGWRTNMKRGSWPRGDTDFYP